MRTLEEIEKYARERADSNWHYENESFREIADAIKALGTKMEMRELEDFLDDLYDEGWCVEPTACAPSKTQEIVEKHFLKLCALVRGANDVLKEAYLGERERRDEQRANGE